MKRVLRRIGALLSVLILASGLTLATLYAEGAPDFIQHVDFVIKSGPYTGFRKTYISYCAVPDVDITGDIFSHYRCYMGVYYTPDLGDKEYDTEENRKVPMATNAFAYGRAADSNRFIRVPFAKYETGETVTLESQTNAIGEFRSIIYAKRDGKWVEVSAQSGQTVTENEIGYAIADYKIQPGDSAIKLRSNYELTRIDGTKTNGNLYFMIYVTDKPITDKDLLLYTLSIIAITLAGVFLAKQKRKKQRP